MTKRKKRATFWVWECKCERCGYEWRSMGDEAPTSCASCGSRYWQHAPGTLKRGRPKKKKTTK